MKTVKTGLAILGFVALQSSIACLPASADEDHPTVRAAHHYVHRKVVHASHVMHHAKAHYHNWKHRKGHQMRAWLNKH